MIKSWFTCKVKFGRTDSTGKDITVTESYLVDAYSYTEAESRITFLMTEEGNAPFHVMSITKNNFAEVFNFDDSEKWFKVKVALITYDEENEKEKQSNQYFLIAAEDVKDAYDKTVESMKGTMSDFVIPSISYTRIMEVYPYSEDEKVRNSLKEKGFKPVSEVISNAQNISESLAALSGMMQQSVDEETGEINE